MSGDVSGPETKAKAKSKLEREIEWMLNTSKVPVPKDLPEIPRGIDNHESGWLPLFTGTPPWPNTSPRNGESLPEIVNLVMHVYGPFNWLYKQLSGNDSIDNAIKTRLTATSLKYLSGWNDIHGRLLGVFDPSTGVLRSTDDWARGRGPLFYMIDRPWNDSSTLARLPPPADREIALLVYSWLRSTMVPFINEMLGQIQQFCDGLGSWNASMSRSKAKHDKEQAFWGTMSDRANKLRTRFQEWTELLYLAEDAIFGERLPLPTSPLMSLL